MKLVLSSVVDNGYDTNWIDETFSTAVMHRNDINLSGATDKLSYYTSASHLDQDGIITGGNSSFKRTTFRVNLKARCY